MVNDTKTGFLVELILFISVDTFTFTFVFSYLFEGGKLRGKGYCNTKHKEHKNPTMHFLYLILNLQSLLCFTFKKRNEILSKLNECSLVCSTCQ